MKTFTLYFLENLKLYLKYWNWYNIETQYTGYETFTHKDYDGVYIMLGYDVDKRDNIIKINNALQILSEFYNIEMNNLVEIILRFESDFHNFRIKKDYNSVSLTLVENILASIKKMLYQATQVEYDKSENSIQRELRDQSNSKRKTELASKYIEQCKFGHTWKGSFGLTIEAPLNIKSLGMFDDETPNFERKISLHLNNGMRIIKRAEELNSYEYIIDNIENGFNAKLLKEVLEFGDNVKYEKVEYSTNWAPVLKPSKEYRESVPIELNSKVFFVVEKALSKMTLDDGEMEVIFRGFPEGFKSTKEELLNDDLIGNRTVTVKGLSMVTNITSLKFNLDKDNYLKSLEAHEAQKDIEIKCKVKRKVRGWEVTDFSYLKIME